MPETRGWLALESGAVFEGELFGAPLDKHVASLPLLVRGEVHLHLRGERVEVRQRPLLRVRRGEKRDEHGERQRAHHSLQ